MPDASTGGTGGRDNTRLPGGWHGTLTGVPEGSVRIELSGDGYVTFTFANSIFTDLILEVRSELGNLTYFSNSGRTFTVPNTFIWGDTIPSSAITWTTVRTNTQVIQANAFGQVEPRYAVGGVVRAANLNVPPPERYQMTCDCEMCQNAGRRRADLDVARFNQAAIQQRATEDAEDARIKAAEVRAEETFRMVLLPDELAKYDRMKRVIVTGADGQRYEIRDGLMNNVWLLGPTGAPLATLCCHPQLYHEGDQQMLPLRDAHAAQVLYLRYDLDRFWETANVNWYDEDSRASFYAVNRSARTRWLADRAGRLARAGRLMP